jgi:hypothetical protein
MLDGGRLVAIVPINQPLKKTHTQRQNPSTPARQSSASSSRFLVACSLQKALGVTNPPQRPRRHTNRRRRRRRRSSPSVRGALGSRRHPSGHGSRALSAAGHTRRRHKAHTALPAAPHTPYHAPALEAQALPALELALQSQGALLFLAEIAFGALGGELVRRVGGLQLVDGGEEVGDLVARFGDVVGERGVLFLATLDLLREVAHGAVDGADAAGFGGAGCFGCFEGFFELRVDIVVSIDCR